MANLFPTKNRPTKSQPVSKTYANPVDNGVKRGTITVKRPIQKSYFNSPIRVVYGVEKGEGIAKSLYLEGVASDNEMDLDGDTMSIRALEQMNAQINSGGIPLRYGHKSSMPFGTFVGSSQDRGTLLVRAKLDESSPITQEVLRQYKEGKQFGFSIGGDGTSIIYGGPKGPVESKYVANMDLIEISLVERPANPRAVLFDIVQKAKKNVNN